MHADDFSDDNPGAGEAISVELVERVVAEIDDREDADEDALLCHLLCAAWPAARSQLQ
jgi:hypothetical protein